MSDHIRKLSKILTPNHKYLQIDKRLQYECPWPSAQEALTIMAAYRTPRDKIACVTRCAQVIMDLLAVSCDSGVPAADDLTPVLVYVIVKVSYEITSRFHFLTIFFLGESASITIDDTIRKLFLRRTFMRGRQILVDTVLRCG